MEYQLPKGADKKNQLGFLVQMKMILSYLASEYDIIEKLKIDPDVVLLLPLMAQG